jgi:hypothetical protein
MAWEASGVLGAAAAGAGGPGAGRWGELHKHNYSIMFVHFSS